MLPTAHSSTNAAGTAQGGPTATRAAAAGWWQCPVAACRKPINCTTHVMALARLALGARAPACAVAAGAGFKFTFGEATR